jgi:integrase
MPNIRLTERSIAALKAPDSSGRQTLYWDETLKGFAVLVSGATNAKTYVVQRNLPSGRARRITVGACNEIRLEVARVRAADTLDALRRGIDPKQQKRSDVTLREALEIYLGARKDLRPASIRVYRIAVERYLAAWADQPLRTITPDMVEARHRSMCAEVGRGARYSGHVTANMAMRHLRIIYNFMAERVPDLPQNPVRRLRRQWYPEKRRTRMVHAEDLPKFHAAIMKLENPIARDLILLMLFTGMRVGEASSLTWADVDLRQRVITIPAERTKNKREFKLPMNNVVRDLLVARRALGNARWVFPSWGKTGHLFDPAFQLGQIEQETGIKTSPHDLRRCFLSVAESCDISPLALKALVNHAGGNDVTSGYVIMSIERLREAAQRVADKVTQLCAIKPMADNVTKIGG